MTTVGGLQSDDRVLREAAEWFVRVQGEDATTEDFSAWQRWLLEKPAHRRAFQQVEDLWQNTRGTGNNLPWPSIRELGDDGYDASVPVAQWLGEHDGHPSRSRSWPLMLVAASLVAAVALGVGVLVARHWAALEVAPDSAVLSTARAEDREVSLSDGSRVTIGAKSRVDVDLSKSTRTVVVDSGEVFFKVAHEVRPFVVRAGEGTITAIGTAFNVRHVGGRVVVTVTEGRVKVAEHPGDTSAGSADPTLVNAGEQFTYGAAPEPVRSVDPQIATAWRSGRLKYLNEPLESVVADVARYTKQDIAIADPTVGQMLYTGTVLPGEVADWLASLSNAFPVDVVREGGNTVLLKSRVEPRREAR